ncbi:effector-associated constant component EACC1 [Streptomyces sp. NPDC002867]
MRITLDAGGPAETDDLRWWLLQDPQVRGLVRLPPPKAPDPGTMSGAAPDLVSLLLAPGGLTAAVAAAIVAWLQSRKVNQTVTITRPDGTQVTVTSERIDGRRAESAGDLAQRVAEVLQPPPQPGPQASGHASGQAAGPENA